MSIAMFYVMISWFFPLLVIISVSLHYLKPKNNSKITLKLPPSPPRLPIIGNLHQLGKNPRENLWKLSQEYGPVMLLNLGSIPTLIISSTYMAKQVLKVHDTEFCSRPSIAATRRILYNCIDVATAPYGDHWREMRKVFVSRFLSPKRVQSFWKAREVEVNHLIYSLSASANAIDLDEKFLELVDGIIGLVAFGKSYRGKQFQGQQLKHVLAEAMELLNGTTIEDFFPSTGWLIDILIGNRRKLERCFTKLDGYMEMVIDEHLDKKTPKDEHEDLVDALIGLSKDETNFTFTKEHIKAILMDVFIAGIDSTAVTMVWTMVRLVKNPRVMQKLQTEIRECIGRQTKIEPDDVAKLTYLKLVLKETLRLHPPGPIVPRESIGQCKICDDEENEYDIPPKTRVYLNIWAIGRDSKSWKNPNEFYPERFEENEIDFKGMHFEFLPFGGGRRICPAILRLYRVYISKHFVLV